MPQLADLRSRTSHEAPPEPEHRHARRDNSSTWTDEIFGMHTVAIGPDFLSQTRRPTAKTTVAGLRMSTVSSG
jgi:hypothetical protein